MIGILITVLSILLIGLLVDWQKILKNRKITIPFNRPVRKAKPSFSVTKKASYSEPVLVQESKGFSMEVEAEETGAVERVVLEEEPQKNGYQPTQEVQELLAEADICFRKGEMKGAENYYLQAAAKDPRCSKAYSRLGVIYLENGENWEDAEAAFRQALKTDPSNGFILNNLGLVLYHQDKYADAVRNFEQAVRQDELNAARYANLGMAYMAMRQYAKAESFFKRALKLAPSELEYKDLLTESIEKKKAHKTMIRH